MSLALLAERQGPGVAGEPAGVGGGGAELEGAGGVRVAEDVEGVAGGVAEGVFVGVAGLGGGGNFVVAFTTANCLFQVGFLLLFEIE